MEGTVTGHNLSMESARGRRRYLVLSPVPTSCPAPSSFREIGTSPASCVSSCCSSDSWAHTCFPHAGSRFPLRAVFCGRSPEHLLHSRHSPFPPPPSSLLAQVESCAGNCTSWQAGLPVLLLFVVFEAESLYAVRAALQRTHLLPPPTRPLLPFLRQAPGLWVSLCYSRDEREISLNCPRRSISSGQVK